MIAAVTFDLWDTLVVDDSDEPERARRGLLPKPEARVAAFAAAAGGHGVDAERAAAAWQVATAWCRQVWKNDHRTPTVLERVNGAWAALGMVAPESAALVHEIGWMEVDVPPVLVPGIRESLRALRGRWPLGIVSDAIVTPGDGLREILRGHDLLDCFDFCVFSDEVGASKPSPRVFHAAAVGLGVPVQGLVHVGDRESNDVAGPHGVGARAILLTAAVDRGSQHTRADAVCADAHELPAILDSLEGR